VVDGEHALTISACSETESGPESLGAGQNSPMAGGELRFDAVTREWVNVVGHRQGRPNLPADDCPFCVGGLEAPEPYDVRAFANRWPALAPGEPVDVAHAEAAGETRVPAQGAAEVILYSPQHHGSLATLGVEQARKVVDLWAERTEALLARPEVSYVLVFENRGSEVGATIHHPHGQIYGFPFVPPVPARIAEVAARHGDPVAAELEREVRDSARVVCDAGTWVAYVPFASAHPYGLRVVPRAGVTRLAELDDEDRDGLARVLVDVVGRYDALFPETSGREVPFPYLLWIHQAPEPRPPVWFRTHVQLAPPWRAAGVARYIASGEVGSGTPSNPVVPEGAAAALRRAGSA
jgi:UDPglucose--hexose-1-phosphate uridylyltransferase